MLTNDKKVCDLLIQNYICNYVRYDYFVGMQGGHF